MATSMEDFGVSPAVSSVISSLAKERELAYSRSSIRLVSAVENKYPLADIIMERCTGERVNGNLEGYGTAVFKDGHEYEGEFHCGVMHGQGRFTWKDGVVYEGQFTDCRITGVGKYTWLDGSTYSGEVLNGLRHGRGSLHCPASGATYTGDWVQGRRHGKGRLVYDGSGESYYDGEWVDNQQEGWGSRRYKSGNIYEGEWHLNERHGRGTMQWWDRGECYSGEWAGGIQHGQGEHTWLITTADNAQYPSCNRYVGEWRNGQRDGNGTFYYASGAVYTGEWQRGLKHGRGEFVFQNGEVFEGTFHCDRMAGRVLGEEGAGLVRPKTPLGSLIGDVDHSEVAGSRTELFNLAISQLLPPGVDHDHELRQVHCTLLRHITQLKKIYHYYSSLGRPGGGGARQEVVEVGGAHQDEVEVGGAHQEVVGEGGAHRGSSMTRMQFWRLLCDCQVHHCGLSLQEADCLAAPLPPPEGGPPSPSASLLMRELLQALVLLAHHIYWEEDSTEQSGQLSLCLSQFIKDHLLPKACSVGGPLYSSADHCQAALQYQEECWLIYHTIAQQQTGSVKYVTLRQILLLLNDCGLVGESLPSSTVVKVLVEDNPVAVDGEDYNLQIKMTFLEFFEALLQCAQHWYRGHIAMMRTQQQKTTPPPAQEGLPLGGGGGTEAGEQVPPVPSEPQDTGDSISAVGTSAIAVSTAGAISTGELPKGASKASVAEGEPGLSRMEKEDAHSSVEDVVRPTSAAAAATEQEDRHSMKDDGDELTQWSNALEVFFSERLFPQARLVLHL